MSASIWTPNTSVLSADALAVLASAVSATEGAALVGFSPALEYADPETVGYQLPWATFHGTGADDTVALQALLTAGYNIQLAGTIYANNLTATTNGQHLKGVGRAQVIKNANGPLITFSGANQCTEGIEWRGDASTPVYTGANVVSTGDNFQWLRSGSRWAHGTALVLQGNNPLVLGQMDIIQSALISSSYDIDCGLDGTARLYGRILGVYTSQNTGGIRLTDIGSWSICQSQFADLKIQSGGGGYISGCNGGNYTANRITGNISAGISSALFSANLIGGATVVFEAGTSGHGFDGSNSCSVSTTITDSSNNSNVVDLRQIPLTAYTPLWTGSVSDPAGGALTGRYTRRGRLVTATFSLVCSGGTTYGSGSYYFSLPFVPSTSIPFIGQALIFDSSTNYRTGTVQTLLDGTARCQITVDSDTAQVGTSRPMTWASGDTLNASITYMAAS